MQATAHDVWQLLASAAVGSVAGVLIKELFDVVNARATHRHELQRRYFETKLEKTLRAIAVFKSASAAVRDTARMIARAGDRLPAQPSEVAPNIFVRTLTDWQQSLESCTKALGRVADEEFETDAAMGFLYGDVWRSRHKRMEAVLDEVFDTIHEVTLLLASVRFDGADLSELGTSMQRQISPVLDLQRKMANECEVLDAMMDELVDVLRRNFDASRV